jgi:hypothetical protein
MVQGRTSFPEPRISKWSGDPSVTEKPFAGRLFTYSRAASNAARATRLCAALNAHFNRGRDQQTDQYPEAAREGINSGLPGQDPAVALRS